MDKKEILSYVRRFVEKRGFKTAPYATFMTTGLPDGPDFAVYKDNHQGIPDRLGTVTFDKNLVWLEVWLPDGRRGYKYNPHDPNSLPNLVEQIRASWIALRGIEGRERQ